MELLINIDVDDLPRGIGFYQEGLGLRLSRKLFDDTVAEMTGGATPIYLLAKPPGTRPTSRAIPGATTAGIGRPCTWTLSWTTWKRRSSAHWKPARRSRTGRRSSTGGGRLRCRTRSGMGFVLLSGRVKGTGTPGTNPPCYIA